jgi:cysteinyl-tRNA synthetase
MHNWFLQAEGEKMSKSLGNVSNLLDLIDIYDPRAYRMVLLQSHYRSPVKITSDSIGAAINSLAGLDSFAARTSGLAADTTSDAAVLAEFREAMDDDLDTPRATALIFDTVRRANTAVDANDPSAAALAAAVHEICDAVGLELGVAGDIPTEALDRARLLDEARAARDFEQADAIRAALQADGWTVETTKDGTTVRR